MKVKWIKKLLILLIVILIVSFGKIKKEIIAADAVPENTTAIIKNIINVDKGNTSTESLKEKKEILSETIKESEINSNNNDIKASITLLEKKINKLERSFKGMVFETSNPKKNNDITISNIFEKLGLLATWITVFLVFKTLKEMQNQRKNSYKPELVVLGKYFLVSSVKKNFIFSSWEPDKEIEAEDTPLIDNFFNDKFSIEVFNLGFAAAKDIKIKWEYDFESLITKINNFCEAESLPIPLKFNKKVIESKLKGASVSLVLKYDLNKNYDYLLPNSISHSVLPVEFPNSLKIIFLTLCSYGMKSHSSNDLYEDIEAKLVIEYLDLGDFKHKKEFNCKMTASLLRRSPSSLELESIHGALEFNRLQP